MKGSRPWSGLIDRWAEFLPVSEHTPVISLCEGNTPLIPCPRLSEECGAGTRVWVKYEGLNPTGSFKDRGMTLAVSKALEEGSRGVICASTGNTSASAAAYAARAGMKCAVLIPSGRNVALGKLAQASMHGATVIRIEGSFDQALEMVRDISRSHHITLVNSVNPYRIEGQKTAAFEVCEQLGEAPHIHCIPVGNAGNITAYWRGYRQWHATTRTTRTPRMWGFQAAGSAPIVRGHRVQDPQTLATAIKIGNPASWRQALEARDESGGLIDEVTDDEIITAYKFLASAEGIFCEPSSAASVAGLLKMARAGKVAEVRSLFGGPDIHIVCVLTGHGLKDPDGATATSPAPIVVPAEPAAVLRALGLG